MSLMKSLDGRLYNVPDEIAATYLIPADKLPESGEEAEVALPNFWAEPQVEAYGWGRNMLAATAAAGMLAAMPTAAEAGGGWGCGGSTSSGGRSPGGHTPTSHTPTSHVGGRGPGGHGPGGRVDHWPRPTPMVVYGGGGGYSPAPMPAVTYPPRSPERFTSTFNEGDAQRIAAAIGGRVSPGRFWRNSPEGPIYIWDVYR